MKVGDLVKLISTQDCDRDIINSYGVIIGLSETEFGNRISKYVSARIFYNLNGTMIHRFVSCYAHRFRKVEENETR